MQLLRRYSLLPRIVLAWFVLTLGVAAASPLVSPQTMQLVCSADGSMKMVVVGDDGDTVVQAGRHDLDCPMCLAATLPAPLVSVRVQSPRPFTHVLRPVIAAHLAARAGAPLPARGPPLVS